MSEPLEPEGANTSETLVTPLRNRRSWHFWGAAAAIVVLGLSAANYYLARHRIIHVVNGHEKDVTVVVGRSAIKLGPRTHQPLELAEGRHVAVVSGAVDERIDFAVPRSLRVRWLGGSEYVLNPGGAALLLSERSGIPVVRKGSPPPPRDLQLYFGERFVVLPEADYLFRDFPADLRFKSRAEAPPKTRVDIVSAPPGGIFFSLVSEGRIDTALQLAEWHLQLRPEQSEILPTYLEICLAEKKEERARAFLTNGLSRRPVDVQWHRMYQELEENCGRHDQVLATYESLLGHEPANSALLYLRGRLAGSAVEAVPFYERAVAADPNNAFAHYALGYSKGGRADWAEAKAHLVRAVQLRPQDPLMQELLFDARVAGGEVVQLEQELIDAHRREPMRYAVVQHLCEVLLMQGKAAEADELLDSYRQQLSGFQEDADRVVARLRARNAYVRGDFAALEQLGAADPSPEGMFNRYTARVESGKFAEAFQVLSPLDPLASDPVHALAIALAMEVTSDRQAAESLRRAAVGRLKTGRAEYHRAAEMLENPSAVRVGDVLSLSLPPQNKAIMLLSVARAVPALGSEFKKAARSLNIRREFPYHMINRLSAE